MISFVPPYNLLFQILIAIDLIILLGLSKTLYKGYKNITNIILLLHGGFIIIINGIYYFNVLSIVTLLIFIFVISLFAFILKQEYLKKIILIINSVFLCGIVEKSIIGVKIFSPRFGIGIISITFLVTLVLGITKYNLLMKIHTILVCYTLASYLVSSITGIEMLSGNYDIITFFSSFLIGLWILFSIVFYEFVL